MRERRLPRPPLGGLALAVAVGALSLHAAAARGTSPPPLADADAERVVALVTAGDGQIESYAVPLHIEARVRNLLSFHVKLDGTVYYKRPERVALAMRLVPAQDRRLFAALGTPLTWMQDYDFSTDSISHDNGQTHYHLRGTPRSVATQIASVLLDVPEDRTQPMRARWTCADGTVIVERVFAGSDGTYDLPKHAEVELTTSGFHVNADLQYGDYALNSEFADSVFGGN